MSIIKEKDLEENEYFLDEVATEVMKIFIQQRNPSNFGDSVQVSRIAYRQAIAMLQTKKNLSPLLDEVNTKDGRKSVRQVEDTESGGDTGE